MFETLLGLLQATNIPFAAYGWDHAPAGTYGVISLEGQEDSVAGDNMIHNQSIRGSIDLFVMGISTAIQYEDDTGLVHYEWIFEQEGF